MPRLSHWVRVTDDNPEAGGMFCRRTLYLALTLVVEYFYKFNEQGPSVMEYSQVEYDEHLTDPDWSPHETNYLFTLLRTYDLRFVIAADRYNYAGPKGTDTGHRRSAEVRG
jgi:DNA methyltransferase 1-associated protein 1